VEKLDNWKRNAQAGNFAMFENLATVACDEVNLNIAVVFNLDVATPVGFVCLFCRVARAFNKNIHDYFYILYMEPLFVVTKIIGPPGKNHSLLLSKLFYL